MGNKELLARVTEALLNSFKSQFDGHAIPGVPEQVNSWTAKGDMQMLDMEVMAKAALAALPTSNWQKIEEAPRDGSDVVMLCQRNGQPPEIVVCNYEEESKEFQVVIFGINTQYIRNDNLIGWLPTPPNSDKNREGL